MTDMKIHFIDALRPFLRESTSRASSLPNPALLALRGQIERITENLSRSLQGLRVRQLGSQVAMEPSPGDQQRLTRYEAVLARIDREIGSRLLRQEARTISLQSGPTASEHSAGHSFDRGPDLPTALWQHGVLPFLGELEFKTIHALALSWIGGLSLEAFATLRTRWQSMHREPALRVWIEDAQAEQPDGHPAQWMETIVTRLQGGCAALLRADPLRRSIEVDRLTLVQKAQLLADLDLLQLAEAVGRSIGQSLLEGLAADTVQAVAQRIRQQWPSLSQPLAQIEILNLSGKFLTHLPAEIGALTGLRQLLLEGNKLVSLPDQISALGHLERLHLARNKLASLPMVVCRLTALKNLVLTGNPLKTLPEQVGELSNLTTLEAGLCELEQIPASLASCRQLLWLELQGNQLRALPDELAELSLQHLLISHNQLETLPAAICRMQRLTALAVGANPLRTLPCELAACRNLQTLDLSEIPDIEIPDSLDQLEQLEHLTASACCWTEVPAVVSRMRALKHLIVSRNRIHQLPHGLRSLPQLTMIDFSANQISSLEFGPGDFPRLQIASFAENILEHMQGEEHLVHLHRLNCSLRTSAGHLVHRMIFGRGGQSTP